ncbi:hypothetical protein MD484_g8452, partial [Candolleomyces efflorescens]
MNTNGYLFNSPYHRLLSANDHSPSPTQRAQIKSFIHSYLDDLESLDSQISEAELVLEQLNTEHTQIDTLIKTHQQLIHPIRLVPPEIWAEIFVLSLPSTHLPVMSTSHTPLSLTQVCRIWRGVALSTPSLWASTHIVIPRGQTDLAHLCATSNRAECMMRWLDRAKDRHPLSISLHWPTGLQEMYGTRNVFPRTIRTYSTHIRELELDLPDSELRSMLNTKPDVWPILEKLALRLPTPPGYPPRGVGMARASIWRSPKLKRVVWESVGDAFFKMPVKFKQLTEIAISGSKNVQSSFINPLELIVLCRLSPNIHTLRIQLTDMHNSTRLSSQQMALALRIPESAEHFVLPNLTTLEIADMIFPFDNHHLELFSMPALTTVKYSLVANSPPILTLIPHPFLSFLRSQPPTNSITTLTINAQSMPITTLFECLKLMPLLESLWVEDSRPLRGIVDSGDETGQHLFWTNDELAREVAPDDGLLQALLPTVHASQPVYVPITSTEALCPRLERLRLDRTRCTLDGIRDFVHTRLALCTSSKGELEEAQASTSSTHECVSKIRYLRIETMYSQPLSDLIHDVSIAHEGHGMLEAELRALEMDAMILFSDDCHDL